MVNWDAYLESICQKYAQWWDVYTLTDVEGCQQAEAAPSHLLDFNLMVQTVQPAKEEREQQKTERFDVLEGLRKYAPDHVLLVGRPGSGKSTALARLLLEEAQKAQQAQQTKIPVLVELRYYRTSVVELVQEFLQRHDPSLELDAEKLKTWLRQGQLQLLLDGLNELPSEDARRDLKTFRQNYQKTTLMVFTTRDLGVGDDLGITKKLEMQPLTQAQMRQFVRAYLPQQGEQMLSQLGSRLREFGQTPLLLMMLCSLFGKIGKLIPSLGWMFQQFTQLVYDGDLRLNSQAHVYEKVSVAVYRDFKDWWRQLLEHLAFVMMRGESSTVPQLVITRHQAKEIFIQFLKGKVEYPDDRAIRWLIDLLNHHLIQRGTENQKIQFPHQLIQEYYTAESLVKLLPSLSDEELKRDYLNYLKWTEPLALMEELVEDEAQAMRVVKLALEVDLRLGARLAGAVKPEWQEQTVGLVAKLEIPQLLKIQLLGMTLSNSAIPTLLQALSDECSDFRWSAASALGRIGSEVVVSGLSKALKDENSAVRQSATSALGKVGSEKAVSELSQALKDENSAVCQSAASALGKVGSEKAVSALFEALKDKRSDVRQSAGSALGEIGSKAAVLALFEALKDKRSDVRKSAASGLEKVSSEEAVPALIQALEHQDSQIRGRSACALKKIGSKQAVPALIHALEDEESFVRGHAASALGAINSKEAVPALIHALEDRERFVRSNAISALGRMGSQDAVPALIEALKDDNSRIREDAISALKRIDTPEARSALRKASNDRDSYIRGEVAPALAEIGSEQSISELLAALKLDDPHIRGKAVSKLGDIRCEQAVRPLIQTLSDENPDVRRRAVSALRKIGSEEAVFGLVQALKHEKLDVRQNTAEALKKIGSPELLPYFSKLLQEAGTGYILNTISAVQERCKFYNYTLNQLNIPPTQPTSTSLMYILHLSDLHFGTPDQANLWSNQLATDLYNDLSIPHLDSLILSGDIANYSTEEEYKAAEQFLHNFHQDFPLNPEQIILVPGNHDLNWKLARKAYRLVDREDYDGELKDGHYIEESASVIRVRDEAEYKQRFAHFSQFYETIKQKPYPLDYHQQFTLDHLKKQNLLILGLNSAWQLDHHYKTRASIHMEALSNALTQIRRNTDYRNSLKIAVWHHPLNSAFEDRITDQGFMEQLAVAGFRLFLHGHIHKAETSLYRYDISVNGRKLDRICAGTFGAPTRELIPGYPWQYNLLKFEGNKLTVHTRRREELNGAWKPDAQWSQGPGQNPLPYYQIQLSEITTSNSKTQSKETSQPPPVAARQVDLQKIPQSMTCAIILTAIPVEYVAVRSHLTNLREEIHPQGTVYERGNFSANGQTWEIGIVEIGAGNNAAALEAERAIAYFNPSIVLFVGVAGGIKDVRLGDVVAATKVYGYESGKAESIFKPRPDVGLSAYRIIQRARAEAKKPDWLQRLIPPPNQIPRVFVAPIAAGEKVVASAKSGIFKFLQSNYGDAVAVEMEGRGLLQAAHANQQVSALIIRGIANLIDAKSELDAASFQETAAHHASAFAFEILAKLEGLSNSACSSEPETQSNSFLYNVEQGSITNQGTHQGDTVAVSIQQPSGALNSISPTPNFPDFFGRTTELNELEQKVLESRVVLVYGTPGVGKTYVSAKVAKALSEEYKVLWLDKEELTLDELLFQINEFLKANGEYGFITTYDEQKIESQKKIPTLVQVISSSKINKYVIFIDNFQHTNHSELKPFIERFSIYAQKSRVVLLDHLSAHDRLGLSLAAKVQEYEMKGFQRNEATDYINKQSEGSRLEWLPDDVNKVIESTDGHPIALNLIVHLCRRGALLKDVLERPVKYDEEFGASELHQKLLKDIAEHLNNEEKEALHRLSVFRIPVQRSAWKCLNIKEQIVESLLQRKWLTSVSFDRFQMHPLMREFWWEKAPHPQDEKLSWHEKAGHYYWELGKNSAIEILDRSAYLEAYYHFNKTGQANLAAQVVNELICYIYQKERLPSERLPGLTAWLLELDSSVFDNKPWLLLEKGCKLEKKGTGKEAEDVFQQAYRAFEHEKNQLGASVALYYVGKILHRKQPKLALKYLDLVLKIAEESCPPDIPMQIRTLGKLISCYTDLGDYPAALDAATHAENLALTSGDRLGRALILYRKGSSARNQSNFSKAEEFFSSSAEAFEKLGDIYRASKSYSRLGLVQERQGKFAQAINNLEKAIKIKRQINDEYGLALDLDYLADVYRSQGLYRQAINRYEESLALKKKGNDVYGLVKTYNNLARVELTIGRLPEANDYLQKSEEGIKNLKENNERYIGLSGSRLIIQGDLKISQGNHNEALHSYQQAKVCFSSTPHSYARVLLSIGRTYLELRKIALAKKYLNDSLQIFEQQHTPYHEALALTYLARLTAITGRIEEANAQNQKAMSLAIENKLQPILIIYQETQGLIEETKVFKEFNFETIRISEKEEITETLIQRVEKHYDAAIQDESRKKEALRQEEIPKEEILNVVRLRLKKILWRLTVKHFIGEQFSSEQAHQLLQTADNNPDSSSLKKLLMLELLITKQTLHILHSISTLVAKRIAEYALYILCPLVLRFGFNTIRQEIESLAFRFLFPSDYQEITQLINSKFSNQKRFILLLKAELEIRLRQKNIQFELQARAKTPYSIYRKKTERRVNLDEIIDLVGFRIITQTKDECYKALDVVKVMGKLYEGEGILAEPIRDYILRPKKSTGYQSIHVNIMIEPDMEKFKEPESHVVEFQIRTQKMDLAAEVGDAAHSLYKSTANYA
ncbi:HEAT repeat domain-containing protein, partial [Planktothrix sp. FACHB-1355]|uniref:HEAT repeat domain-containing protein n=1 Tax=Planktothrix sp. FACHB-1355 TaxID=2692854 RepID=UPI001F55AA0F